MRRHRASHVAQRVKFFVGRTNVFRLADHEHADFLKLLERTFFVQVHVETRNAFQFIERAAGNSEAAIGNHRHPDFIARQQRREHERNLVAHAAGGMFVDLRRRTFWISEDPPALHHRFGQMMRFSRRHPAEEHRHGQRAHLVIGKVADHEILDQVVDFLGRQRLAVPFLFNERWEMHGLGKK